ncbi:MAG: hypothetical protein AAF957_28755 [Planctomycetota bacterium]
MPKTPFHPRSLAGATLALLSLAACSSTPDYTEEYGRRLTESHEALRGGALLDAHTSTIELIDDMDERGVESYEVQRALADALMVHIHASAVTTNGFLTEPERFSFELSSTGSSGQVVSETAHRVAAIFHAWHLLAREQVLANAATPPENPAVAPGRLEGLLGGANTTNYATLILAGSYAQLGFDERSQELLRAFEHPEKGRLFTSTDLDADNDMVEVMDEYGLPQHLQWHLFAMGHELLKRRFVESGRATDPTLAYRLGCRAAFGPLEAASEGRPPTHTGEVVDPGFRDEFYAWAKELEEDGLGTFESIEGTALETGVTFCRDSGEPAIEFTWQTE